MSRDREMEERYDAGEFRGCTYIAYSEIEAADWSRVGIRAELSEWSLLFKLLKELRSDLRFADAGLRIVCWATR